MQLQDIRTRVRERLGMSTNDTAVTNAILTQLINASIRKIDLMHDWPWLVATDATFTTTVAAQASYSQASSEVASNWRKTLFIISGDNYQLIYKQEKDLARFAQISGHPSFYTIEGDTIIISPKPDEAYTIRHVYIKTQTALSADTDEPSTHDWAMDAVIENVAMLTAARLRDKDLYRMMQDQWSDTLVSLRDELRRTRQMPKAQHRSDISWT